MYVEVAAEAAARGEQWEVRYLRTTSALERLNPILRQMVRQVVLFHSHPGPEVRVYVTSLQAGEMLIPQGDDWLGELEEQPAAARCSATRLTRSAARYPPFPALDSGPARRV